MCLVGSCMETLHPSEAALDAHYKEAHPALQTPDEQMFNRTNALIFPASPPTWTPAIPVDNIPTWPANNTFNIMAQDPFAHQQALANHASTPRDSPATSSTTNPSSRVICPVCHASFSRKGDLDRHSRKHANGPRYYCRQPHCRFGTKGFDRRDKLMDHMRRGHKMVEVNGVWVGK
jgi:hypothetical protein